MENRKLKIGILASNVIRIPPSPPEKYVPGGWSGAPELMVSMITEGLVSQGHDVTLFASGDSQTGARLVSVTEEASYNAKRLKRHEVYEYMLIAEAYRTAVRGNFDILHSHLDMKAAHFAAFFNIPTVVTIHDPITGTRKEILSHYKKDQFYVSISDKQRESLPDLNWAGTVHHGLEIEKIPFSKEKDDYLIFFGRISRIKGTADAIKIAKKSGHRLLIFGSPSEADYWKNDIEPLIDGQQIIFRGMVGREDLFEYVKKAKAFLFPLQVEEAFGLAAVESMACGTPVIAYKKGSLPEIIDEKTGFLVDSEEEIISAINKIDMIDPNECRKRAAEKFSIGAMIDGYEKIYYKILKK
ncbi:MAG: glycosyltransferase family 4 protein [Candidatus Portnoybacteria bacterium]|nr:glycosyltransferase family 4 protein [Candidatus Portnoybacteria bacterium]